MKRLAILLSGRGSNFEAIARNTASGRLAAEIAIVISNRAEAPGLEIARTLGLPAMWLRSQEAIAAELRERPVDLICLAGFMRLLSPEFVREFSNRILNIHPSLLPAFPGLDAQSQALAHGVKISGCTVHFVNEQLDAGPIVRQAAVPVLDADTVETLSARILEEEHRLYTEAIRVVLDGDFRVEGRRVVGPMSNEHHK